MISLQRPTHKRLKDYLWQHQDGEFNYEYVGGTQRSFPEGFVCGHKRIKLGIGRPCYLQAKQAMKQWEMFPDGFAELIWPCPIEAGKVVATLFRGPGLWTLNPCRIAYTIDDVDWSDQAKGDIERFGFAYGTVGDHLLSGEERFSVEYHHADETVWYEIYCFSKVNHWLSVLTYPYLRMQQHRFRALSALAMQRAVQAASRDLSFV